jgi:hypothetical protein
MHKLRASRNVIFDFCLYLHLSCLVNDIFQLISELLFLPLAFGVSVRLSQFFFPPFNFLLHVEQSHTSCYSELVGKGAKFKHREACLITKLIPITCMDLNRDKTSVNHARI